MAFFRTLICIIRISDIIISTIATTPGLSSLYLYRASSFTFYLSWHVPTIKTRSWVNVFHILIYSGIFMCFLLRVLCVLLWEDSCELVLCLYLFSLRTKKILHHIFSFSLFTITWNQFINRMFRFLTCSQILGSSFLRSRLTFYLSTFLIKPYMNLGYLHFKYNPI